MNPRGMVPSRSSEALEMNESDTLLGGGASTVRRETSSRACDISHVTCKKTARLARCLAIGALLFTILSVGIMTVGSYGPEERALKMKERYVRYTACCTVMRLFFECNSHTLLLVVIDALLI